MNTSNRFLPIGALVIALVIVAIGLSFFFNNSNPDEVKISKQKVSISIPNNLTASIYNADQEHGNETTEQKPLQTVEGSKTITIDTGAYRVETPETPEYAEASTTFTVVDKPLKVSLDPDYNEGRLTNLLKSEKTSIHTLIANQVPAINKYYKIEDGWLYKQGNWYATKLTYKGPTGYYDNDTLKVVAKKENNTWKLITKPPVLNVSTVVYPEIPFEIASDINNFR